MYHINCDDAQTDQGLVWSYIPQINASGKQNQSQRRCEARDVSNAQTDPVRDTSSNDTSSTTTLCRKFLSNYQFVEK